MSTSESFSVRVVSANYRAGFCQLEGDFPVTNHFLVAFYRNDVLELEKAFADLLAFGESMVALKMQLPIFMKHVMEKVFEDNLAAVLDFASFPFRYSVRPQGLERMTIPQLDCHKCALIAPFEIRAMYQFFCMQQGVMYSDRGALSHLAAALVGMVIAVFEHESGIYGE
jgi:hypothetical protein